MKWFQILLCIISKDKMLAIILSIMLAVYLCGASDIKLDSSNKFRDMLVYINDDVSEGDGSLLNNIKNHLEKASSSLWKATGNMQTGKAAVQFGTIHIRIPMTWKTDGEPITWQQCNKADFYVTIHRDNNNRMEPYTKQLGKCGEKAEFTKFSEEFFKEKSEKKLVSAGKKIMNEFVRLRYGVFSEKPYSNVLTVFNGLTFINSTCGANISWTLNKSPPMCSDRNKECNYTINPNQNNNYSVMFDTETPESEYFCNDHDKPHNRLAHSLHNVKCARQSISAVILKHPDFSQNKLTQRLEKVEFKIIKGKYRKIALVLDISSSMTSIVDNMRKACAEFIETIEDTASVGLAVFSSRAEIRSYASVMNPNNRQNLINLINSLTVGGYTNIGDGIAKGIEILGGNIVSSEKVFGTIILLSDGGNNQEFPYRYEYAIDQVIAKGIAVITISYGTLGDRNLNKLAELSGGKFVFAQTQLTYSKLLDKFSIKQSCDQSINKIKMIEATTTMTFGVDNVQTNLTYIDQYIGKDIQFTLSFKVDISRYKITVLSPSGKQFSRTKIISQSSGTTLVFDIPGRPERGMYKLQTSTVAIRRFKRSTNTVTITFRVSATPLLQSERIINPTGLLSRSEIEVLTDLSTIQATVDLTTCSIMKNETVSVNLSMISPSNNVILMPMTDDGLGDDSIEDDKIFTKKLIAKEISELGFYNFLAYVEILNTETKDVIKRTVELGSMRVKNVPTTPIQDRVPPAKIEDVNLVIVSSEKKKIRIEILSTGNDGMLGNISDYEIKITFPNGEVNLRTTAASAPKTKLNFTLDLSERNVTNPFEVAIRGIDENNNAGEWSLSKTSNWNYASIARIYVLNDQPGGPATHSCYSIIYVEVAIAFAMFMAHF